MTRGTSSRTRERLLVATLLLCLTGCGLFVPSRYATFGFTGTAIERIAEGNTDLIFLSIFIFPLTLALDSVLFVPYAIPHDIVRAVSDDGGEEEVSEDGSGRSSPTGSSRPPAIGGREEDR